MDIHFRSWLCARNAVWVCVYWIYDKWWTVFNMILVLWTSHSHKPLKTCWKCLLKRPAVFSRNYLNTTSYKISMWSFVCEPQILLYNDMSGLWIRDCLVRNVTGYGLLDDQNFIPDKIYFRCHFCPLPFSFPPHQKFPHLNFSFPHSFCTLHWPPVMQVLVVSVSRHTVMYWHYDHCKHHFVVTMQLWQDSHGLLPLLTFVAPHAVGQRSLNYGAS